MLINIKCNTHNLVFQSTWKAHYRNSQLCPVCRKELKQSKRTNKDFIVKAKEKFGDKYDYSKVTYINSKTKVNLYCSLHGDFFITPYGHLVSKNRWLSYMC